MIIKRGEDLLHFLDVPPRVLIVNQMTYVLRYVSEDDTALGDFQVASGQLLLYSFCAKKVTCLPILVMILAYVTIDGKHISFPLSYYADSLV